ncbi:MAG: hypothetical protein K5924_06415 [Chloroflexi bacterium]|nr:hypothetical protein [Chloroflexota bacterium]
MTVVFPEFAQQYAASFTYDFRTTTVGVIAVILLVVLLIVRELVTAWRLPSGVLKLEPIDIAIPPLLLTFGVVVLGRLADLL